MSANVEICSQLFRNHSNCFPIESRAWLENCTTVVIIQLIPDDYKLMCVCYLNNWITSNALQIGRHFLRWWIKFGRDIDKRIKPWLAYKLLVYQKLIIFILYSLFIVLQNNLKCKWNWSCQIIRCILFSIF